jgi:hypothetical protein
VALNSNQRAGCKPIRRKNGDFRVVSAGPVVVCELCDWEIRGPVRLLVVGDEP